MYNTIQLVDFRNRRFEWMPSEDDRRNMATAERVQAIISLYVRNYAIDPQDGAPLDIAIINALREVEKQFTEAGESNSDQPTA